jgi:hypothetical protein
MPKSGKIICGKIITVVNLEVFFSTKKSLRNVERLAPELLEDSVLRVFQTFAKGTGCKLRHTEKEMEKFLEGTW